MPKALKHSENICPSFCPASSLLPPHPSRACLSPSFVPSPFIYFSLTRSLSFSLPSKIRYGQTVRLPCCPDRVHFIFAVTVLLWAVESLAVRENSGWSGRLETKQIARECWMVGRAARKCGPLVAVYRWRAQMTVKWVFWFAAAASLVTPVLSMLSLSFVEALAMRIFIVCTSVMGCWSLHATIMAKPQAKMRL